MCNIIWVMKGQPLSVYLFVQLIFFHMKTEPYSGNCMTTLALQKLWVGYFLAML